MKDRYHNLNPKKQSKVYRVVNIMIMMAFLFNMSAFQGLALAPTIGPTTEPECIEGPSWAYSVVDYEQGTQKDGGIIDANRSDPNQAVGPADSVEPIIGTFFSLGLGGWITLDFQYPIIDVENSVDLSFHEDTWGNRDTYPEEKAAVEVSQNGTDWTALGEVSSQPDADDGVHYLDLADVGLPWIQYVRLSDITDFGPHGNNADGFDLDAVDATHQICYYELQGYKWHDQNENGMRDCEPTLTSGVERGAPLCEPFLGGWTIQLFEGNSTSPGDLVAFTETNSGIGLGGYNFSMLHPGLYTVCEIQQDGWYQIYPNSENSCHILYLGPESNTESFYNFGNNQYGSVGGYKYEDLDGNGQRGDTELGLSDWTIELWPSCSTEFSEYDLVADDVINLSDLATFAQQYHLENLSVDFNHDLAVTNHDFYCFQMWYGTQAGDQVIFPVTSAQTNGDGYYQFDNIQPGGYFLREVQENGWHQTSSPEVYGPISVGSGDLLTGYDFGNQLDAYCGDGIVNQDWEECDGNDEGSDIPDHYYCTDQCTLQEDEHAIMSGYKYEDLNGNGQWDEFEQPINDWEICGTFEAGEGPRQTEGAATAIDILPFAVVEAENECVLTGSGEGWLDGYYQFKTYQQLGLATITETQQTGYTKTEPAAENYEVTVSEPIEYSGNNFGNQPDFGVLIDKAADVETVSLNQEFSYTVSWEVFGLVNADEVTITDALPVDVSFVTATDGGIYDIGTHAVTWTLTDVAPGTSGMYGITVQTASDVEDGQDLVNTVEIMATKYLDEPAGASALGTVPVVTRIDKSDTASATVTTDVPEVMPALPILSLDKKVSSGAAESNEQLTYTIDWAVSGDADAHQVIITDPVPADSTIVSVHSDGEYDGTLNSVTWDLGTKSPGESGSVTMVVNTNLALAAGTVVKNTATIDSAENDPVEASATTMIMTSDSPILQITKDASTETLSAGDLLTYTVVVTNVGAVTATNTMVDDLLPAGLTFADGGKDFKSFTLGDVGIGESVTLTYDVNVDDTASTGSYENLATTYADNYGKVTATATVEVESPIVLGETTEAELTLTKSADVEFTNPGGLVEYTVTITNNGTEDAQNVILTDHLPEGLVFESTTELVSIWEFSTIAVGATETLTYKASVNSGTAKGMYDNIVVATADNAEENSATSTVEVRDVSVLGDLTETGTTFRDYVLYFLGVILVASGIWFFTKEKKLARSK